MTKLVRMRNMKIERIALFSALMSFLLLFGFAQIAQAQTSVNQVASVSYLNVTPQPLIAGENATISFRIFNSYQNALQNTNIELISSSQIFNTSPAYSVAIGTVGSGQYGGTGTTGLFQYKFHVPSTLPAGEYTIEVLTTYQTDYGLSSTPVPGQSTSNISLYVYGVPDLELSGTLQGAISPGATTAANLNVVNAGTDTARNVSLTILSNPNFSVSGPSAVNLGIINSGSTATAQLNIQPSASLKAGTSTLPIQISYTAQSGMRYSVVRLFPINFLVNAPDIVASIQSAVPSQLIPGGNQTAQVLIQNTGHGDAKNLSITFTSTAQIKIQSSASTIFVGTLAAGSSVTESVQISATGSANQTSYNIPVAVKYNTVAGGNATSAITYMPVSLVGSAAFNITAIKADLVPGSTYQPVTLTIKNTGNQPAQQVTLSLQTVFPLTPSNPNAYLNSLAPGESTNVTFFVSVDTHGVNGTYPITLYEQWKQPNSGSAQLFSNNNNYFAPVGTAVGQSSSSASSYVWIGYVVVIVVVVGVAYRYREQLQQRLKPMMSKIKEKKKR